MSIFTTRRPYIPPRSITGTSYEPSKSIVVACLTYGFKKVFPYRDAHLSATIPIMNEKYIAAINQLILPCGVVSSLRCRVSSDVLLLIAEPIQGEKLFCPICQQQCPSKGKSRARLIRHHDFEGALVYVKIQFPRVICPDHGFLVCAQSFCDAKCKYSREFEASIATRFVASELTLPDFARQNRVGLSSLRRMVERHIQRNRTCN